MPKRRHCRCSGVFNVNFRHVSQHFLVFFWLNWNQQLLARTLISLISKESKVEIGFYQTHLPITLPSS